MPQGWLFMLLIILLEACVMSRVLLKKWLESGVFVSALVANAVSGIVGFVISMILTGGWWLVIWFPWVSSHEVNVHNPKAILGLVIYYFVALILSVLIEWGLNHLILRKKFTKRKILMATLLANATSYTLGAVLITLLCIL
ncbi:MAG: hypothetical protein IK100_06990 [Muribaculaceae bacterium]|nr:hypothetical protein [Muribaculaceae bacterium]